MKKIVFPLLLIASMGVCTLQAQDTVHVRDFRTINQYFVPIWPDAFRYYSNDKVYSGWLSLHGENFDQMKEEAYKLYTTDTLQVYGIAASLTTTWRFNPDYYDSLIWQGVLDTSCEFIYDYLRLYEAEPDSLRHIGDELLVNLRYTPVSYYVDLDLMKNYEGDADQYEIIMQPVLPIYERFFTAPVTVTDSFYVGRRYRPDHHGAEDVSLVHLADSLYYGRQYFAMYVDFSYESGGRTVELHQWMYGGRPYQQHPFLFPIIAPPDTSAVDTTIYFGDTVVTGGVVVRPGNTVVITAGDTLIIGGDTIVNPGGTVTVIPGDTVVIGGDTLVINVGDTLFVNPGDTLFVNSDGTIVVNPGGTVAVSPGQASGVGVHGVDLLYRYTAVMPNPARHRATVTSSFGLSRIDLYDARGRLLKSFPASGLKADLDLSPFPSGTYLLRILTPAGQTTKKLLIQ